MTIQSMYNFRFSVLAIVTEARLKKRSSSVPFPRSSFADLDGEDDPAHKAIFHLQHLPDQALKKRQNGGARPITECYEIQDRFQESYCQHWISPKSVIVHCIPHYDDTVHQYDWYVNCQTDEICVDGIGSEKAYCVSHQNFVRIQRDQSTQTTTPSEIEASFTPAAGTQYAVEALLTGPSSSISIFAANLDLEAQRLTMVNGAQVWRALDGGRSQCSNCASVNILNVPVGTQRIYMNVALQAPITSGLLYLSHIAS